MGNQICCVSQKSESLDLKPSHSKLRNKLHPVSTQLAQFFDPELED